MKKKIDLEFLCENVTSGGAIFPQQPELSLVLPGSDTTAIIFSDFSFFIP
jgi:hypothetical protein